MYYEEDITEFIGDSMVEESIDETEPRDIPFDAGDPIRDYRSQELRALRN